ncbi:MAG TPA: hypothetical protein VJ853_03335, partial [Thermoanaerobaculia bacterium]|nr:hypothetical protein [Thermoanaerobaculia bacterium]
MKRMHLRTRVLLLTALFALTLLAITFGLSWRARVGEAQWHQAFAQMQAIRVRENLLRTKDPSFDLIVEQRLLDAQKQQIANELPRLERQTRDLMLAGLAIAWIVVICSFAAVQ